MMSFPRTEQTFLLPSPAGSLEVMATWPNTKTPIAVAVICHPDPRHEGTMHNKVVTTLARTFDPLNLATVRFNFRGVGKSTGEYGQTQGELADLETVIAWVRDTLPELDLWLAGFSFGSYISALAAQTAHPARLISISPAVNFWDFNALSNIDCPWLVIQGDQDDIVPCQAVQAWAANPPAPVDCIIMPGASHFFHGQLVHLREHVTAWCA